MLTDSQILDLAKATQKELGRSRFQQIAQNLRDYEVMGRWLKKDKMVIDSGMGIQRTLMNKLSRAGKMVGLHEADAVNIADVLAQIEVPWRRYTTNYSWERRELLQNGGAAKIVDIMKVRKMDMTISTAEDMEEYAWSAPASSTDKLTAWGIPYWIVKNGTQGFNGGNPTGFSDCAGIDASTDTKWRNYTDVYTTVNQADLITKMRRAALKIAFKSPVQVEDFTQGTGDKMRVYLNDETLLTMEGLLREQNDNLGGDVASFGGTLTFKRHPIIGTEILNTDTSNPIYMINHGTFYPVVLKGDYLRETEPKVAANQHNTFVVHCDLSYNFLNVDRRRNAVLYVA
jgi:hypothetical protein